ncbi:hypothetical protein [Mastigocoleus sp. MO_188.B34]|uniref:hypothetical protein n=1 Tax=Mastigocoleus sp. MO_188.B34 TaxID=3036635 RepID=UPI00261E64F6|nr:hypothetical protein [Mastigocoleus sp. MO_188.B34]MDJ0693749.1 hypothetical protein [Mastigocoleus sp. MO_188.B34]
MKRQKLGVFIAKNVSILRLILISRNRASMLSAVFATVVPAFLGVEAAYSSKTFAQESDKNQKVNLSKGSGIGDLSTVPTSNQLLDLHSQESQNTPSLEESLQEKANSVNTNPVNTNPVNTQFASDTSELRERLKKGNKYYKNQKQLQISSQQETAQAATDTIDNLKQIRQEIPKIEIAPIGEPRIQADGRSTIKIRGEITDANNQPINDDVMVTLTSSAGKFIGADQNKDQPGFQVIARGGEFIATLQSGIKAQQVRIRAAVVKIRKPSPNLRRETGLLGNPSFPQQTDSTAWNKFQDEPIQAYTQVEFTTYLRPSLVTGVVNLRLGAKGTDYWGSRSEFLRPGDSGTEFDVDAAVFATGSIGEWLFTGAFNSDRPLNEDCEGRNRLFGGVQFCEQKYPVYGDSSSFTSTAPSIDSFYARLERTPSIPGAEPDYLMWGDYNTKEFTRSSQLYTATSRQLHGFKANYNFGNLQFTGLYANNIEGFQRDTFIPNGTSGNYFLSRRLLVPGSETVYLESEEINRPGTVVERKQLFRGQDYDIDYDRGTLLFRRPILATELNPGFGTTLVRKVVVTYQNDGGDDSDLFGGRLQYNFSQEAEEKSFVAGSYLLEDQGDRDFELFGADFQVSLGDAGKIIGEYARSNSDLLNGGDVSGNAYRIEAFGKISRNFEGTAYYRAVEPNFVNNATFSFFPGQTRYGASLLSKITNTTSLRTSYDIEENYGIAASNLINFFDLFDPQPQARPGERVNNELRTFRAGILQKFGNADLNLEYVNRSREDRVSDRFDGDANQLVSGLKLPLTQSLTFQAQNELNLGDSDPLYPNRTTLGMDWKAYPGVTFRLAHQFYDRSELLKGNSITTFDTILDHKFSENTALTGRYSVLSGFNGLQGQGAVGLGHGWAVAPGLRMNVGYEYVFKNVFNATALGNTLPQYYAVGQTASSLGLFSGSVYSVGLEYTDNPDLKASARMEYRDGAEGNNTVISAAAAGKISPALTALLRYQQAGEANVFLPTNVNDIGVGGTRFQELGDTANLKVGLAYRDPNNDKFNALLKYEWRQNFDSTIENQITGSTATGHTLSAEGIYAPNWRWELYGKYAFRNGVTYFDGDRFNGNVNLAQMRATYRTGYRTDLALEGRWIGQNSNNNPSFDEFGWALEGGYYLSPDLRLGVGYSFGSIDDRDFSGYRSRGGLYLNVSLKLNELLNGFGLQKPVPKQQQESQNESLVQNKPNSEEKTSQERLIRTLKQKQALNVKQPSQSSSTPVNYLLTVDNQGNKDNKPRKYVEQHVEQQLTNNFQTSQDSQASQVNQINNLKQQQDKPSVVRKE